MKKDRNLVGKGEFDYDFHNDVLFFKVRNREYDRSIEADSTVIDIDTEDFIVGMQIFGASEYLGIPKMYLKSVFTWNFRARLSKISKKESLMEVRLLFKVKIRNKIYQPTPIITRNIEGPIQDSQMLCTPARCVAV